MKAHRRTLNLKSFQWYLKTYAVFSPFHRIAEPHSQTFFGKHLHQDSTTKIIISNLLFLVFYSPKHITLVQRGYNIWFYTSTFTLQIPTQISNKNCFIYSYCNSQHNISLSYTNNDLHYALPLIHTYVSELHQPQFP